MSSGDDCSHLESLRTADLNWLTDAVLDNPDCCYEELSRQKRERLHAVLDHLNQFADRAAGHEAAGEAPRVRDEAIADFADRVGSVAIRARIQRRLIRIMWRSHTPRSWVVRQIKVQASAGGLKPPHSPAECPFGRPRPRRYARNFSLCVRSCDAAFYVQHLELSFAEVGYVIGLPKSTAEALSRDCAHGRRTPVGVGIPASSPAFTPEQARQLWDLLRGIGVRAGTAAAFSWRAELRDWWQSIWLGWR